MPKKYTVIETWIVNEVKPAESTSAEQTYERLEKVAGILPVLDIPQDLTQESHFVDEALIRDFVAHISPARQVLDIGCGDGWPLLRIAPFFESVTGIDAAERRVANAKTNAERLGLKNVTVKKMSALNLEFPDESFDGVTAATAIEQTPDPYQALREVFRVLKPGGKLRVYFETFAANSKGVIERVFVSEIDDALGYHYVLKHPSPPWERSYLVKFSPTPEMKEEFRRLKDLIERLGSIPTQAPEIGLEFLQRNQSRITGGSWYELEHFTSATMKQTLEEIGFTDVRICYSAGTFARKIWSGIAMDGLNAVQLKDLAQALAELTVTVEATSVPGEPITASKPE